MCLDMDVLCCVVCLDMGVLCCAVCLDVDVLCSVVCLDVDVWLSSHCMRAIGLAERAMEVILKRVTGRVAFGRVLSEVPCA